MKSTSPMTRTGVATLLTLPLFVACLGPSEEVEFDEEQQLDLYMTTASFLYQDDSLDRAQSQAVKALEIDPDNREMRRMIGWIRLRQGSNEDLIIAEQFFRELLDEGDESQASLEGLATSLERLGSSYDRTSRAYVSGERVPLDGQSAEDKARSLADQARDLWHESLDWYHKTITEGEGSTRSMTGLARVHALLGDYDESLVWADRIIERQKDDLDAWQRMLQSAELTQSEEQLFRTQVEEGIELVVNTHLHVATLLESLGRDIEAIDHLDQVAIYTPGRPQVYSLRAQLREKAGDYSLALEDIDRFLRLSEAPYEDPEVRRAFDLRSRCEGALKNGS